jgi:hypothetical protein
MTTHIEQLPAVAPSREQLPTLPPQPSEANPVALEMAATHRRMVEYYRYQCKMPMQEAIDLADKPVDSAREHQIRTCEPEQLTWPDMHALTERDPALSHERWEEIRRAAIDELRSGHRAAKAMETMRLRPWSRAQFLAVRDELAQHWQPTNGIEWTLIDTMAQCYAAQLYWMEKLTLYSGLESHNDKDEIEVRGCWTRPRVTDSQAIEQAASMVERFNRLFLRTLRVLTDLRRSASPVVIRAGQVNVGQQQVNMAQGAMPSTPIADEHQSQRMSRLEEHHG